MQIDIDFDVFKALTALRREERDTLNDVLRRLTGIEPEGPTLADQPPVPPPTSSPGCVFKGVQLPEGTRFRATYKGKVFYGEVKNGEWNDEIGNSYNSPSHAAHAVTGSGVNGWTFWECKRPSDTEWARLVTLRNDYVPLQEALSIATIKQ